MNKLSKRSKLLLVILLFVLYSIGLVKLVSPTSALARFGDPALTRFIENYKLLRENWLFFTSNEEVLQAATDAMTNSNLENDRYTEYISNENSDDFLQTMNSSFVGIGIEFFATPDYPLVTRVIPNAPAQEAGLQVGDIIIKVDNQDIRGLNSTELRDRVIGDAGSVVNITVMRGSQEHTYPVTRAAIDSSINFELIDDVGYIAINQFSTTTDTELLNALNYMNEHQITRLVLDLRNNPGGRLDTLERSLDLFLPANKIVLKARDNVGNIVEYKTTNNNIVYDGQMIILVNNNSASAAEAFTAALSEQLDVPVYGQTTFGKGIMQNFFTFPDQSILKYTNAEWLTPNGNSINQEGIHPTKEIELTPIQQAARMGMQVSEDIKFDTVSANLIPFQRVLRILGYNPGREDGYFSQQTLNAIHAFNQDHGIVDEDDLSVRVQSAIISQVLLQANERSNDVVLNSALQTLRQ